MTRTCILLAGVAVLLCVGAKASAQDVPRGPADDRLTSGDLYTDSALAALSPEMLRMTGDEQLRLTDDQRAKIRAAFATVAKEITDLQEPLKAKYKPVTEKMSAMRNAAKGPKALADDPDYKMLQDEVAKLTAEWAKTDATRHDRLDAELAKILTPLQMRKVRARSGVGSKDPVVRIRSRAVQAIDPYLPSVELGDKQYDQMLARLVPMIEKYDADLAKSNETDPEKLRAWAATLTKNLRDAIDSLLTDAQRKQAAANRAEQLKKKVLAFADMMAKWFDNLNPTADQKQKLAAIVAAVREAMLKLEFDDRRGMEKLAKQAYEDFQKLLTDDQKALQKAGRMPTSTGTGVTLPAPLVPPSGGPAASPEPKATPTPAPGDASGDRI